MPVDYFLGVDGGGSATRAVIISAGGIVHAVGKSGPSNPITVGVERALANIIEAVNIAAEHCGVSHFKASRLGVAGTDRSKLRYKILSGLPSSYGDVAVVSDAAAALAGATGCGPGVVVIAGTGSIAYGQNPQGVIARAGGWGWKLGDEGSGYIIGRNAILSALRAHDGRAPDTMLRNMIQSHLKLEALEDIVDWMYAPGREPRDIANLVPLVREAEAAGDEAAKLVMAEAGAELGHVTNAVIRRLELSGEFPVAVNGGVFKQPSVYITAFEKVIRREAPYCAIIIPRMPPVLGAALLALKSTCMNIGEGLLRVVEESYTSIGEKNE